MDKPLMCPAHRSAADEKEGRNADLKKFREEALKAHNEYRAIHDVKPLKMSEDCNLHAQEWAEYMAKTRGVHNGICDTENGQQGMSVATKKHKHGANFSGDAVTDYWYAERDYYGPYGREPPINRTNHFAQMVWKDSKEFGIGKANDAWGGVVVVGSYQPPGMVIGGFTDNVKPPNRKD